MRILQTPPRIRFQCLTISSNTIVGSPISVGSIPIQVLVTPDGKKAYVLDSSDVTVISTATNAVTATISIGSTPTNMAMTPDGTQLFVSSGSALSIYVISTISDSLTSTISWTLSSTLQGISISADGSTLFASEPLLTMGKMPISGGSCIWYGLYGKSLQPRHSSPERQHLSLRRRIVIHLEFAPAHLPAGRRQSQVQAAQVDPIPLSYPLMEAQPMPRAHLEFR